MPAKLAALLRSRRFWTAVAGVLAITGTHLFGLDEQQTLGLAGVLISWILGDSIRATK